MATKRFEIFQTKGYDDTIEEAKAEFRRLVPGKEPTSVEFEYAYPGRPGEGRQVGMKAEYDDG